jgi:glutaredoxin 3
MAFVEIYTKVFCSYCVRAKKLLASRDVAFTEYPVDRNEELLKEMIKRSGGATSVPQIFIDDTHIGGCDDMIDMDRKKIFNILLGLGSC